jgi:predicted small secreted protein
MQRYLILFAVLLGLSACETVGGMGRDLGTAGDAIEDAADETEARM